jgi:hypothetical protein
MAIRLNDTAEVASSDTLAAFAQVIRALAPEVCSVSFHDFAADTLWLSEDFLLPEDHQLVEETLSGHGEAGSEMTFGAHDGTRYAVAIPVRDAHGDVNGAVRLGVDSQFVGTRTSKPLNARLAPVLACLAVEFERRVVVPSLPPIDEAQLAQVESALNAERHLMSAIVRLAADLGVQTVSESVELDAELQAVRSLGEPTSLSGYDFDRKWRH